ncbi:MAG: choline kinase [Gammaproteobacteria bacterium]|nr:DUF1679 domain-containing protein [Gammaproteobacteria bacterium]PCH63255.1 MAG: choline kinase [Gammaproteobacteria bacterium]
MNEPWHQLVLTSTSAKTATKQTVIQSLWSGYGEIIRVKLDDGNVPTCIVKHIKPPNGSPSQSQHPRGWNSDLGHKRKLRSYEVEIAWYRDWSQRCDDHCRVPQCYSAEHCDNEQVIVLEDIDASGFPLRKNRLSIKQTLPCLSWLAHFHAKFLNETPSKLWPTGTYWHLATRPEEFSAMRNGKIKSAAFDIDRCLNQSRFQSLVHGDAKVANFCFSSNKGPVAAVDFQYVGGGCGMKDVAYFLSSCLSEDECEHHETQLLDYYFATLKEAINTYQKNIDVTALEKEWRMLYSIAWADFYRFLLGWMPTHQKINRYTKKMANQALQQLTHTV